MNNSDLDVLAIGDITTDAFIRLKEAEVHCDVSQETCKICMDFASKIPYEFVKVVPAVGNSANAAVAAARLGLKSGLVSNIGDDQNGKDCLSHLENEEVGTGLIKIHADKTTNYHYVLWYQDERTILIKHEIFDYNLGAIGKPKWIYLSSLGEVSLGFHNEIGKYLALNPDVSLAFQPGTYQIKFGYEKLREIYARTKVFFSNVGEAQKILETKEENISKLLAMMKERGPEIVVITDGKKGAYMNDGEKLYFMPPYPDEKPPYERTGAGDAFSSTFVSALALGKTPLEALTWGPINSMSVVQYIGAQEGLLSREKLEEYLKTAPENYRPQKLVD